MHVSSAELTNTLQKLNLCKLKKINGDDDDDDELPLVGFNDNHGDCT